ncbi:MAG: penicillin-binding protein [Patescibacteria group bacterium]|nr:penicillin-binding protein [Patescibacteria group bacterium]
MKKDSKTGKVIKLNKNRDGLKSQKPKKYRKTKIALFLFGMLVLTGIVAIGSLFAFYAKDLPNPERVNRRVVAESTKIYDRTGEKLLYEIHGEEKRTIIPMKEIPDAAKYATIVLEDDIFYAHSGFDIGGLIKAVCHEASSAAGMGDLGGLCPQRGGSTITQQFIKNSILTSERSYSRKIKEIILAIEIEQKFEKDEILRMYLNEIPYGSNAYGIEAAAQTFFGKHAKELTLAQAAMLATLPNAPTYYSPHGTHTDRLLARWSHTIDQMANLGYITDQQAEDAKNEDILSQVKSLVDDIDAPHFVLYVKEKLVEEFGGDEIKSEGLKVVTTLDWNLQQLAEKTVREGVEENGERYNFENAALVATNPRNGQVLAMVGSRDYFDEEIDGNVNVATRLRQPGSSFKPYVYAQAFREGYTPKTTLFDVKTEFSQIAQNEYKPQNYDGKFRGPVQMEDALGMSLNIPAVKALYLAGVKDSIRLAKSMGITDLNQPERYGLSLVLGGGEVKLLDHVGAFGVFANEGVKHDQRVILKIEDSKGEELKNYEDSKGKRVLEKEVALEMCEILSNNKFRAPTFGTANPLNISGRHVIAKTGTTNEYRDGWLVGSSKSLAAGVWTGNNDNREMAVGAAGANVAGPIWNTFMKEALSNHQDEKFEDPKKREKSDKKIIDGGYKVVERIDVCKYDDGKYCLSNKHCPKKKKDDKKYFTGHNILHYVDKEDPLGKEPKRPKDDPQYKNWEKAVKKWGEKHADGKGRDIPPEKECDEDHFSNDFSSIKIASPGNDDTIDNDKITIKTDISGVAEVRQVDFFFDGENIGSRSRPPFEIDYRIPSSKNNKIVAIRVKLYDEEDGNDEDKISVKIDIHDGFFSLWNYFKTQKTIV